MVRIKTLREMADSSRRLYRVRWRYVTRVEGRWQHDTDGSDSRPETWSRWEEEYFSQWHNAKYATTHHPWVKAGYRPPGVIDFVSAGALWQQLLSSDESDGEALDDMADGHWRVLPARESEPEVLACDRNPRAVARERMLTGRRRSTPPRREPEPQAAEERDEELAEEEYQERDEY